MVQCYMRKEKKIVECTLGNHRVRVEGVLLFITFEAWKIQFQHSKSQLSPAALWAAAKHDGKYKIQVER